MRHGQNVSTPRSLAHWPRARHVVEDRVSRERYLTYLAVALRYRAPRRHVQDFSSTCFYPKDGVFVCSFTSPPSRDFLLKRGHRNLVGYTNKLWSQQDPSMLNQILLPAQQERAELSKLDSDKRRRLHSPSRQRPTRLALSSSSSVSRNMTSAIFKTPRGAGGQQHHRPTGRVGCSACLGTHTAYGSNISATSSMVCDNKHSNHLHPAQTSIYAIIMQSTNRQTITNSCFLGHKSASPCLVL